METPDDLAGLFIHLAHGSTAHRAWLLRALESWTEFRATPSHALIEALIGPDTPAGPP